MERGQRIDSGRLVKQLKNEIGSLSSRHSEPVHDLRLFPSIIAFSRRPPALGRNATTFVTALDGTYIVIGPLYGASGTSAPVARRTQALVKPPPLIIRHRQSDIFRLDYNYHISILSPRPKSCFPLPAEDEFSACEE